MRSGGVDSSRWPASDPVLRIPVLLRSVSSQHESVGTWTKTLSAGVPRHRHYDGWMPTEIDVDDVQRLVRDENATLIEVLPEREFAEEHLPGALNVPLKGLTAQAVADLDRSRPVIAYCHDDL